MHKLVDVKLNGQELSSLRARNRSFTHMCNWNERQSSKGEGKACPRAGLLSS